MSGLDRKEQIEAAALACFCERGFAGTTVPQIAEQAGVSVGLMYRYFSGKEELVNHLYRLWKENFRLAVEPKVREETEYRQQFGTFCRLVLNFAREKPQAFAFLEAHHHGPYLDEVSLERSRVGREGVLDFLRMGQHQGWLKDLPAELLLCVLWGSLKEGASSVPALSPAHIEALETCCWQAISL